MEIAPNRARVLVSYSRSVEGNDADQTEDVCFFSILGFIATVTHQCEPCKDAVIGADGLTAVPHFSKVHTCMYGITNCPPAHMKVKS